MNNLKKFGSGIAIVVTLLLVVLVFAGGAIHKIDEGYLGVRYRMGSLTDEIVLPGYGFHIPFIENVEAIDTREHVFAEDFAVYTRDTQTVESLAFKLNYIYDRARLQDIIRNIGIYNVESNIIAPQVRAIGKNVIGQYRAEDLISQRSAIQQVIQEQLFEKIEPYGITVVAFSIENIEFEATFEEAIRNKVQAEQEALRAINKTAEIEELARQLVITAQADADAKKLNAEADAYSIRVIQEELARSAQYVDYKMIERWDGVLPQAMGATISPFVGLQGSITNTTP